nr:MAG TPA: hypothetical protein [Bacteriophage sp.]
MVYYYTKQRMWIKDILWEQLCCLLIHRVGVLSDVFNIVSVKIIKSNNCIIIGIFFKIIKHYKFANALRKIIVGDYVISCVVCNITTDNNLFA